MACRVIVACGALKGPQPAPALDLYRGGYFADCRRWALSVAPRSAVYVLSARHGLIRADRVIEPYEQSIHTADRRELAGMVHLQAMQLLEPCTAVGLPWFVGGARYREVLQAAGVAVRSITLALPPGRGSRGIGAQRSWLLDHLGEVPAGGRP